MVDYKINVPRLDWLIGGSRIGGSYNRYFGSCGTDGKTGFLCNKIFNYTVWIEKEDEREYIKAAVYTGANSFKNTPQEDITAKVFECEEESREEIEKWLNEEAEEFFMD